MSSAHDSRRMFRGATGKSSSTSGKSSKGATDNDFLLIILDPFFNEERKNKRENELR